MKLSLNLINIFLIFTMLLPCQAFAFNLDETVDDEIRKNYNDSKLVKDVGIENTSIIIEKDKNVTEEEELPNLPTILKNQSTSSKADIKSNFQSSVPKQPINYSNGNIKIKKGTIFKVVNSNAISDWQKSGTTLTFELKTPLINKDINIPSGTKFKGEIVESHQPQITCNGGLVSIRIYSMNINGQSYPINAYITNANDKKIFLNDIKGNRTYLKTMWKNGNWGRSLFNKMLNLTVNLGKENSTFVLAPFPIAYGSICLGANALVSPITAFFSKGGHVSIPAGQNFKLKLSEDAYIN